MNTLKKILDRHAQEGKNDLTGEHPLNHPIQLILLIAFLAVWITDSFFLELTNFPAQYVPMYLRLTLGTLCLALSLYLTWTGLKIIFVEEREKPMVVRKGPFNYVRHPVYLASILLYLGLTLFTFSLAAFILVAAAAIAYNFLAVYEEKLLLKRFGAEYEKYMKEAPRWVPRIGKRRAK